MHGVSSTLANGYADMWDGAVAKTGAASITEAGYQLGNQAVATGSTATGARATPNCNNWASVASTDHMSMGYSSVDTGTWFYGSSTIGCNNTFKIYCISAP
jgi:hypothetical protein